MKKILLLGGTGYIGTNLSLHLSATYDVTVTGRVKNNKILNETKNINFLDFTLRNLSRMDELINSFEVFVMLIPNTQPHYKIIDNNYDIEQVVKPTQILFEKIAKSNKKVIFTSTGGAVYGNSNNRISGEKEPCIPLNRYGTLKLQLENHLLNLAETYELSASVLRISNPYGGMFNGFFQTGFINQALYNVQNNTPINIWGDGTQIRDFIHISDLCKYIMGAISLEGVQVINIGTGKGNSLLEVVEKISEVYGKNIAVNFNPEYKEQVNFNVLDISKSLDLFKTSPSVDLIRGLQLEKSAYVV